MIYKNCLELIGVLLLAVLSVITWSGNSQATTPVLPLKVSDAVWRPLQQRWDQRLQVKLDQAIKKNKLWQDLVNKEKMAVGLVDLSNPLMPRFAQVNGNTMMYAASLPKIAILLAAYQSFEDGSLKETPQIRTDLIEMIRRSSNPAASQMVACIGLKKIERVILDPPYRFYDVKQGGGIWMGGSFARAGQENPDPLKNLLYAATANQICRYYYLLAYGKLINPSRSRQMLKILAFPDLDDKVCHRS
jgi:beta-lactamase class A